MKMAITGDVMLGRLVNQQVVTKTSLAPETIWGDTLPLLLSADCRLINLECVISARGQPWNPLYKPFHFRSDPRAIEILRAAGVDCATLANNHVLDYGPDALGDCLTLLDHAHIHHPGAGNRLDEALAPAFLSRGYERIAVIAVTDNMPEWEATESRAGVNYVAYDTRGLLAPYRLRIADVIRQARQQSSFVIISAHIGPNWGEPSPAIRHVAREFLDLGGDLYWGHSNHTPQGVEIYHGKGIFYSTGDYIDDYMIDPHERNDLSFLFYVEEDSGRIVRIHFYPIRIDRCRVRLAKSPDTTFLQQSFQAKCMAFRTDIVFHKGIGLLDLA